MKNVILVAIATILSCSVFAQNLPVPTKWKLKKFGVSFGSDLDMIQGIDYDYIIQTAKGVEQGNFSNVSLKDQTMYAGVCENPQLRLIATLEVPGFKNTELNLALNAVFNRYDGVYYDNYDFSGNGQPQDLSFLSVGTMTNELGLESSFTKRISVFKFVNLYGGAGTNLGYTFNGNLSIEGHEYGTTVDQNINRSFVDIAAGNTYSDYVLETYDAKDAFHQRVFAQVGVGVVFRKKLEIGIDYRGGVGYRAIADAPFKKTRLHSTALTARWILD